MREQHQASDAVDPVGELAKLTLDPAREKELLQQLTDLRRQVETLTAQVAGQHDVIATLWSLTDPDMVPELRERINRILGAEDMDGECGNAICHRVAELERQVETLRGYVQQIAADLEGLTWLSPVSAAEMNARDRWLAGKLKEAADAALAGGSHE